MIPLALACGAPAMPQMPQSPQTPEQPQSPETPESPEVPELPGGSGGAGGAGGGGCATFPLSIYLNGHKVMNRNKAGQSQPAEVKVYLLRGRQTLDAQDFDTIRRDGEKALAADLVDTLSFAVFPGKFKIKPFQAPAGTAYVAFVGLFRKPPSLRWKLLYDVRKLSRRCAKGQLVTPLKANLYKNTLRTDRSMPAQAMEEDQE